MYLATAIACKDSIGDMERKFKKGGRMNPVFAILVVLAVILLWFLLSPAFIPLGKIIYRVWRDAVDEIKKDEKEKEE